MLFSFIKYTQPAWQFNLIPLPNNSFASCYISEEACPSHLIDERFETKSARLADAGYRLWNKGVLLEATNRQIQLLHQLQKPSLKDEYTFIRKYWGKPWAIFALLMRIAAFKNPFYELKYFFKTKNINRINPSHLALASCTYF